MKLGSGRAAQGCSRKEYPGEVKRAKSLLRGRRRPALAHAREHIGYRLYFITYMSVALNVPVLVVVSSFINRVGYHYTVTGVTVRWEG